MGMDVIRSALTEEGLIPPPDAAGLSADDNPDEPANARRNERERRTLALILDLVAKEYRPVYGQDTH